MVIDIILTLITLPCDFYLTSMSSKMFLKVKLGMTVSPKLVQRCMGIQSGIAVMNHVSHLYHCNLLRLRFGISQLDWRVFPGFSGLSDSGNLLNRNLHKKEGDIYQCLLLQSFLSLFSFLQAQYGHGETATMVNLVMVAVMVLKLLRSLTPFRVLEWFESFVDHSFQ